MPTSPPNGFRLTRPGIPLHSEFVGGESDTIREVPPEWRAALDLTVEQIPMPWDRPIIPLSDTVLASKAEQQYTSERMMRTTYKPPGVFFLYESYTDRHKQLGVRTKSFHFIDDWPSVVPSPSALTDVETRNYGNKHFELKVDTLPGLFVADEFCAERNVVTPPDFRALLEESQHCYIDFGTASAPPQPLPTTPQLVIKWCDTQIDVYTHKICKTIIDTSSLPRTISNKETNRFKQVVSVDRVLELDTATPMVPTALLDVEFTKLGDGTALEIRKSVPNVFDEKTTSIQIEDLVPSIFRAVLPITEKIVILPGISVNDPQILATGDLFAEQRRETEFTIKETHRGRSGITYPQSRIASREIGGERFGGEIMQTTAYLNTIEPPVETGLGVLTSEVRDLGNGTWFRTTQKWDIAIQWPTLPDRPKFDEDMQVWVFRESQVVDPSYTPAVTGVGDYFVETTEAIDQWHKRRVKITKTPTATDVSSALTWEEWHPYQFPGWLATTSFGYYIRKSRAELCQHINKKWWVSSATKPTISVDAILMDNIIVSTLNDVTKLAYSGECLHDAITTFGTLFWPATTPDKTTYVGSWIGSSKIIAAEVKETDIPLLWRVQITSVVMR